jgi:hypothetical protein
MQTNLGEVARAQTDLVALQNRNTAKFGIISIKHGRPKNRIPQLKVKQVMRRKLSVAKAMGLYL